MCYIDCGSANKVFAGGKTTMDELSKSVVPVIESVYETFTNSERIIADYFINNSDASIDFSAVNIAGLLHVSEASLTRFSKKCGYTGYREFVYIYKTNIAEDPHDHQELTKNVLSDYDEILQKTYSLIDEEQIERIIQLIINAKRVYFYGIGSSGFVASEMKSRFMRLGLYCDALTDQDMIKMNSALVNGECLIIALSISSASSVMKISLEQAKENKAKLVLLTANKKNLFTEICDEIVPIAMSKNLSFGNRITPQFPLLVLVDILYAFFLNSDINSRKESFTSTLLALDNKEMKQEVE